MYKLVGVFYVIVSAIAFGFMAIFARFAYEAGATPMTVLFFRFFIASFFMLGFMKLRGLSFPRGKVLFVLILMGGIGYVGQSSCFFTALNYASAGLVALLLYLHPALVTIATVLIFKEKITSFQIVALVMALSGTILIVGLDASGQPLGILLGICAAIIYTCYILTGSWIIPKGRVIESTTAIMISAAAVFGIVGLFNGIQLPTTTTGMLYMVAIALVSTVIALVTFFLGMERIGPSNAATISTLEPVVTIILAIFLLNEMISIYTIVGGSLILMAILILTRLQSPKKAIQ